MRTWDDIIKEQRAIQGNYLALINEVARMEITEEDEMLWGMYWDGGDSGG